MGRKGSTCLVACLMTLLPQAAKPQEIFRFSGYVVTFPSYLRNNGTIALLFGTDETQFVDVTRVRLRPSLALWDDGYFMLEYEINSTYATSSLLSQNRPLTNPRQAVDLNWKLVESSRWNIVHFIDRLYFRQTTPLVDITVGRQRISWGTGRIWNPTDLFNPLNPTTFSKIEKDGVDALMTKFVLGNFSDVSVVFNAKKNLRQNNYGARFRSNVEGFDFSVMSGMFDGRTVLGGDLAGSILDAGVRFEGIYSISRDHSPLNFVSFIAGVDNQFTERLYALAEYHFNGRGSNVTGGYDLQALFNGEVLNVGRIYGTALVSYLVHPLINATLSTSRSFTDNSGFIALTAVYSSSDETSLTLGGQYFYGGSFTEYWYYPRSLYLKFDVYF